MRINIGKLMQSVGMKYWNKINNYGLFIRVILVVEEAIVFTIGTIYFVMSYFG